jgi:putative flippase GtrA
MKMPILFGVLGLLVGEGIYLLIYLLTPGPIDYTLSVVIALATGIVFYLIGRWMNSRRAKS